MTYIFISKQAVLYQVTDFSVHFIMFVAVLNQTGKFVLCGQDIRHTGTYTVLTLAVQLAIVKGSIVFIYCSQSSQMLIFCAVLLWPSQLASTRYKLSSLGFEIFVLPLWATIVLEQLFNRFFINWPLWVFCNILTPCSYIPGVPKKVYGFCRP